MSLKKLFATIALFLPLLAPIGIITVYECYYEVEAPPVADIHHLPDFSVYADVKMKKQAFFDYMLPWILMANQQLLNDRASLLSPFTRAEELTRICRRYSRDCQQVDNAKRLLLLPRVDIVPPALALSQAAMESGWGGSRFAWQGFNFFGHWCFKAGCGMVPRSRQNGASHEVKIFTSPLASVQAYFLNLNTHSRYQSLRERRLRLRLQGETVTGLDLVGHLQGYSERGQDYVDEIEQMIRYNQLVARVDQPFWAAVDTVLAAPVISVLLQPESSILLKPGNSRR